MSQNKPDMPSPPPGKRRSIRRWGIRVLVAGSIACVLLYASLPLWLPMGWLSRRLAARLSADLNCPVTIESAEASWSGGVVLKGLQVASPPGIPTNHLARVGRIHCGLTPLTSLLTGRVDQLEFADLELWFVFDEQGRPLNFLDPETLEGGQLPSLSFRFQESTCHVVTPAQSQTFEIANAECRLQPKTGRLRFVADASALSPVARDRSGTGHLLIDADVIVPRLKSDEVLQGTGRIEWTGLALSDLPSPFTLALPIEQVEGTTEGKLGLTARPDLRIDYDLSVTFDGVHVLRRGTRWPVHVPDARLGCRGYWDPSTDLLSLHELDYETDALHLHHQGLPEAPALRIDPRGETRFLLDLTGEVKDWDALAREFPEVGQFIRAVHMELAGNADLAVTFTQDRASDRLQLALRADDSSCRIRSASGDYLRVGDAVPKELRMGLVRRRANEVTQTTERLVPEISLRLGELFVSMEGSVDVSSRHSEQEKRSVALQAFDILPALDGHLTVSTSDLASVCAMMPYLGTLTDVAGWRGPSEFHASIASDEGRSHLGLNVRCPGETVFSVADRLRKRAGRPLSLSLNCDVPHGPGGQVADLRADLTYGLSRVQISDPGAHVEYRVEFGDGVNAGLPDTSALAKRPIAMDASWDVLVEVEGIEDILTLFPRWEERCLSASGEMGGSASASLQGVFSAQAADWLVSNECVAKGDDLRLRWGDLCEKPFGQTLQISGSHRIHRHGSQREQVITFDLNHSAGSINGMVAFSGPEATRVATDFEHLSLKADLTDLDAFLALSPAAKAGLGSFMPDGSVSVELDSLLIDREQHVSLAMDATGASFYLPGPESVYKPAGMPTAIHLEGQLLAAAPGRRDQRWRLNSGTIRLAGTRVDELKGDAVTSWPGDDGSDLTAAQRMLLMPGRQPHLDSASLQVAGTTQFDDTITRLHPQLSRWCRLLGLEGNVDWQMNARLDRDELRIQGTVDGEGVEATWPSDPEAVSIIAKPRGQQLRITYDLGLCPVDTFSGYRLNCKDLKLELDGNMAQLDGQMTLTPSPAGRWRTDDMICRVSLDFEDLAGLTSVLGDELVDTLAGRSTAEFIVSQQQDDWRIGSCRMDFDRLAIGFGRQPIHLDGRIDLEEGHAEFDHLRWAWGPSDLECTGVAGWHEGGDFQGGHVGLAALRLDIDDLGRRINTLADSLSDTFRGKPAATRPEPDAKEEKELAAEIIRRIRSADFDLGLHIEELNVTLPLDVKVTAETVSSQTFLQDGNLEITFTAVVDGGIVTGSMKTDLNQPDPTYHLAYQADRIQPGPVVDTYLLRTFPGMTASAPLTIVDESVRKLLPSPDDPNYDVGKGELVIEGGTVAGRAAPLWMTRIFPGLNLASFDFSYMHSWFTKTDEGRIRHQMIFQGNIYSIYMVGDSDSEGNMTYEVGIDFLADFDSRYWAESGQGRVPLFTKTGRIQPDGTLANERVEYVPRQFIISLLVNNNPVLTAYHAVRKRVLGQE